jgi:hypothetical protein
MAIGEAVTAPTNVPLRMPGATAAAPFETKSIVTLRNIEKSGDHQVAHVDQRTESAGAPDQPKVTGSGTIEINLDRSYVRAGTVEWNISGNYPIAGQPANAQAREVSAIVKVTMTASEEPK